MVAAAANTFAISVAPADQLHADRETAAQTRRDRDRRVAALQHL
jgi:hypothetical protein